jgi:wyosine [tRNA(Phe)-imidazoG37] synthetase (radical SAM superfamily)
MQVTRRFFFEPQSILNAVVSKVDALRAGGETIDYLTFVPDGEPTLDVNLGRAIELLRPLGIPIAVITNAALIGRADVRADLYRADWVSLKLDAVRETSWRQINRPHGKLKLASILDGAREFAANFKGKLVTETMLVDGINDGYASLAATADFVAALQPDIAYLAVPTRPPALRWVRPPSVAAVNRAWQIFSRIAQQVELLIGYEGNAFAVSGNVAADLLSITAVHPMQEDAVRKLLARCGAEWSAVQRLIDIGQLLETEYLGHKFYLRNFQI